MKTNTKAQARTLAEAVRLDLFCEVVKGLGEWILRVERTEEEITRGRSSKALFDYAAERGLRIS